jgi:hypothetical protein
VGLASATVIGIVGVAAVVLFGADFDRPTVLVTNGCADPLYLDNAVDRYTIGAGATLVVERAGTGASYWRASDRPYGSGDAGTIDLLTPTIVGAGCPDR